MFPHIGIVYLIYMTNQLNGVLEDGKSWQQMLKLNGFAFFNLLMSVMSY